MDDDYIINEDSTTDDDQDYIEDFEIDDSYYTSAEAQYFNDMRKFKLLTQEELKNLFIKVFI